MSKKLRKRPKASNAEHGDGAAKNVAGNFVEVESSTRKPRRSRLWLLVGIFVVLVGSIWFSGIAALAPQALVRQHVARSRLDLADYWLSWAERLSYRSSENALLAARIARYRGDGVELKANLSEARLRGADLERVELERILAMAQVGALVEVETDIGTWLQKPGAELDEVCNAYANGLAATGRFDEALQVLYAWRSEYPNDPRCDYRIGRLQEHRENYDEAQESYRKAIALDPDYFPARFSLGRAQLHQRQAEEALDQFRYCLQMEQPQAAIVEAAVTLKALGRADEARPLLKQVLEQPRETIEASYRAVEEQPEGFRAASEYGRLESDAGNFEEALPWLRAALQENPLNLTVRYSLGVTLRGLGQQEEAEAEFEKVRAARERMSAATALNAKIQESPEDIESRLQLGELILKNESERIGLYWIRSIFSFDPNNQPAHKVLAEFYTRKAAKDLKYKALADYHHSFLQSNNE